MSPAPRIIFTYGVAICGAGPAPRLGLFGAPRVTFSVLVVPCVDFIVIPTAEEIAGARVSEREIGTGKGAGRKERKAG